jgi:hypothetical protein
MHAVVALGLALAFPTVVHPHHGEGPFERSYRGVAARPGSEPDPFADVRAVSVEFSVEEIGSGVRGRSVGWSAQCNGAGGELRIRRHRLVVSEVISTAMGCEPRREHEDFWLMKLMEGRPSWHLDGRRLVLAGRVGTLVLRPVPAVR